MKHYLVFLEFNDTFRARRAEFRKEHLEKAWAAVDRGELLLAGALTDPMDSGLFFFKGNGPEVAENFVAEDPYINNGLVSHWRIREWATTVGHDAASPIHP